jgi:tetrahydrodipicolinate N-succinyltransferase
MNMLSMNKLRKRIRRKNFYTDVVIGNDVWIGLGATILSGVTIGDGAVIGTQSVFCAVTVWTLFWNSSNNPESATSISVIA